MKKRLIIMITIILSIGIILETGINIRNKEENNILQDVKVQDTFLDKNKTLSIMVEQYGGDYKEDTSRASWPNTDVYEYEKAECTDGDGTTIPSEGVITFSENNIHVKTKNTIYCTLYFKIKGTSLNDLILASNQLEGEQQMKDRGDTLRRYQGQVENDGNGTINKDVNNYICFETKDKNECADNIDKYMYRIIGIDTSNKEIKIIKKEAFDSAQPWDTGGNTWENSSLKEALNSTLYLNNVSKNWSELIKLHDWKYGDIASDSSGYGSRDYSDIVGADAYKIEQEKLTSTLTNTKIGLMYPSDYWLSGPPNLECMNRAYWLECKKNWLHMFNNDSESLSPTDTPPPYDVEWTISRSLYSAWYVENSSGRVDVNRGCNAVSSVRPVFFLPSALKVEGTGSLSDPYRIMNVED